MAKTIDTRVRSVWSGPLNRGNYMKWFLILWIVPVCLLGAWYGLSYYDMNFGFVMLSRQIHDLVFQIYGNILGVPPEDLPRMVFKAVAVDSLIVLGIVLFRYRKGLIKWAKARRAPQDDLSVDAEESLSRAP